ncbi:MAG: pyridoxal-phosphate dependent enzyme [Candidatus Alcyoniella australis]|nr:pyridoxal-phosphate dependent enzyme [Candidatus Alcyoniella australis]
MSVSPLLFKRYPGLARLPWLPLIDRPTPVAPLERLAAARGLGELWIKRDDLTNPDYGGNKPRKFEFLFPRVLADRAKGVVTTGGIGTNHGIATAVYARRFGLECHVVLFNQPLTDHCRKALRLMHYYGAKMHWAGNYPMTALKTLGALVGSRLHADPPIALILPGGSNALGTLGFVEAGLELAEQVARRELPEPRRLFVATGSCGTTAGLLIGLRLAGLKTQVIGVQVAPRFVVNPRVVAGLANKALGLMRANDHSVPQLEFGPDDIPVLAEFYGGAYGQVTQEGLSAVRDLDQHEGLKVETTYTGKALAAMLAVTADDPQYPTLFWNTFSSVDLSRQADQVAPADLPAPFQRFFDGN